MSLGTVSADRLLEVYAAITIEPEEKPEPTGQGAATDFDNEVTTEYLKAAVQDELDQLAATSSGGRNDALNRASFSLGQLVGDGLLVEAEVYAQLEAVALAIGLDKSEIGPTIRSGLQDGKAKPRGLRLKVYRNGHGPESAEIDLEGSGQPLPSWTVEKPFDLYNYKAEDGGVLDCWLADHGSEWLYVTQGYWLKWGDTHWVQDEAGTLSAEIQATLRTMNDLAEYKLEEAIEAKEKHQIEKAAAYLSATKRTAGRVSSVERMARAHRPVLTNELDGGGHLLNFPNCTYDLNSYAPAPHSREDCITHVLNYEYDENAECPRWLQFLNEVLVREGTTEPDQDLIALFQEAVGYALTSETKHEAMFWLPGEGGNGKTVALTVISELLGPLTMTANFHTLHEDYTLADLPGKRLLFSTESERGQTIAEGVIKNIVSGERIRARQIYGAFFEFRPVAKLFWAVNNLPVIKDTSASIWRRLYTLPFYRELPEGVKDTNLIPRLRTELPGILNWAIWGLYRLRQNGKFTQAEAATSVLEELKIDANPIARWIDEKTSATIEPATAAATLYDDYRNWAKDNGHMVMSSTSFGRELKRAKVGFKRSNGARYALILNS